MPSERRFQPVTLADVARHARVSQSTASRVLNGSARTVGGELAQRVMTAATELQYSANLQAQAVARGTTTNLALLVSDIAGEYFSSMTAAVMASAEAAGLRVTIAITERRIEREIELVRELRGQNARAIVLAESGTRSGDGVERLQDELRAYEEAGGKVVVVSRTPMPFDFVDLDNFGGAHRLAAALTRLGYERFHVLGGDETLVTTHDRIEGFRAGLAEHGLSLPDSSITFSEFGWDGAFRAVSALDDGILAEAQALFALNDEMALGAIAGLRNRGMRVPDDIALAGFDDIRTLRNVVPGLTTVRVPTAEIGAAVVDLIIGRTESPTTVPATVVLRETTPRLN
jgi:LacI family transcriptional regulator